MYIDKIKTKIARCEISREIGSNKKIKFYELGQSRRYASCSPQIQREGDWGYISLKQYKNIKKINPGEMQVLNAKTMAMIPFWA